MSEQTIVQFTAILSTALALAPGMAHAMELPNKMRLPRDSYLIAQRLYRGWQFAAVLVVAALVSTFVMMRMADPKGFPAALVAFLSIIGTQLVFWSFTFPVNKATKNWTHVADNWAALRRRWEFSHAASAILNLLAVVSTTIAVLAQRA